MTRLSAPLVVAVAVINGVALAQGVEDGMTDPMAQLRACAQLDREARLE